MSGVKAIPTTYNGRVYRSRLESNVALMLDQLGIEFEHEPASFLLDDGTHYMPDFWCPKIRLWIEVRGYSTPKADRQIALFGQAIMAGRLDENKMMRQAPEVDWRDDDDVDYMVVSPGGVSRFFERPSWHTCEGEDSTVIVCLCKCGQVYFASEDNDWRCRACGESDKHYHMQAWGQFCLNERGVPVIRDRFHRVGNRWEADVEAVSVWIEKARQDSVAFRFTPARGASATLDSEWLTAQWPSLRDHIWSSLMDRAMFGTATLAGVEGNTLIVKMRRGILALIKDERKQEAIEKIRERLGQHADARFIDDTSSYGK